MSAAGVVNHDVRVGPRLEGPLPGEEAVQLRRVLAEKAAHLGHAELPPCHAAGPHQLPPGLHPGEAAGNPGEILPAHLLLLQGEGAVVRGHRLNLPPAQGLPKNLLLLLLPQGRGADVAGRVGEVLLVIQALVQDQVLGAGLHVHRLAPLPGPEDLAQRLAVGEVDDDDRGLGRLGDAEKPPHRLRLQIRRAGLRMAGGGQLPQGLFLRDHAVNHPGVFAVDAADAPQGLQLLQRPVEVPVPQQHGGVGHVHFKRGDALGEHGGQLRPDALVPVVDGHMEAVVAEGLSHGLLPPAAQAGGQGLPLVGAGEVDDGGGASPERRPASRGEAVGGDGARHLQVEMGVGVDEAGEEDAARHVDDPVRLRPEPPAQGDHLLPLHQQVRPPDALAGNYAAALEQCAHIRFLHSRCVDGDSIP